MNTAIRRTVTRWARETNRRRLFEEILVALTWVGVSLVVAVGAIRLGQLAVGLGWIQLETMPSKTAQWAFALWATGWVAKITGTRALWRYRKRRTRPRDLAGRLDAHHQTDDLFASAMTAGASDDDSVPDEARARTILQHLERMPHALAEPFRAPIRGLIGVGLAAAAVALLPIADDMPGAVSTRRPPIEPTVHERLQSHADRLEEVRADPRVPHPARIHLASAVAALSELRTTPEHALNHLSDAEQALDHVATELPEEHSQFIHEVRHDVRRARAPLAPTLD